MLDRALFSLSAQIEQSFVEAAAVHKSPTGMEGRPARFKHALVAQLFSHFKAVRTLVSHEHDEEAQILLRSMTDLLIRVGYLNVFPEHWLAMIKQGLQQNRKGVEELAKVRRIDPESPYLIEDQELIDKANLKISAFETKEGKQPVLPDLFSMALAVDAKSGLGARGFRLLHRTQFYLFSDNAHSHPDALQRFADFDPSDDSVGLLLIPPAHKVNFALYHACSLFLTGWLLVDGGSAPETPLVYREQLDKFEHHASSARETLSQT